LALEEAKEMVLYSAGQSEEEYAFANMIAELEQRMENAARNLQFEKAAAIRDKIAQIRESSEIPTTRGVSRVPDTVRARRKGKKF
jgi:excinuclease UvrABC helicase subunit UvrB